MIDADAIARAQDELTKAQAALAAARVADPPVDPAPASATADVAQSLRLLKIERSLNDVDICVRALELEAKTTPKTFWRGNGSARAHAAAVILVDLTGRLERLVRV